MKTSDKFSIDKYITDGFQEQTYSVSFEIDDQLKGDYFNILGSFVSDAYQMDSKMAD